MYFDLSEIPMWVIVAAQTMVGLAMFLTFWRIVRGPTMMDRIVALDLFAALIMAQLVTLVLISGFVSYLNAAAAIAVISFIATVALARYLETQEDAL